MANKLYTCSAIQSLIDDYTSKGGEVFTVHEGALGYGLTLLYDTSESMRFFVITEVPCNEWSSAHKLRGYNEIPKKYLEILQSEGLV